jgi:hypothetical protein
MNVNLQSSKASILQQSGKTITPQQITQIIEAIVEGKYSWACVLMLHSIGYNPLDYIPYRTYARLIKDHGPGGERQSHSSLSFSSRINDLDCLEPLERDRTQLAQVQGGSRSQVYLPTWITRWF